MLMHDNFLIFDIVHKRDSKQGMGLAIVFFYILNVIYHKIIFNMSMFFCKLHTINIFIFWYNFIFGPNFLPQVTEVSFGVNKDKDIGSDTNIKDTKYMI